MKKYEIHPLAEAYPPMTMAEKIDLRESLQGGIIRNADPILVFENKIIDGRHRYGMALELELDYPIEEFLGTFEEAEALVVAKNGARRHLKPGDNAVARAKLRELHQARIDAGQSAPGAQRSIAQDAKEVGVSARTMNQAVRVVRKAAPTVLKAVEEGRLSLKEASALVDLPAEAQTEIASTPKPKPKPRGTVATPRDTSQQKPSPGSKWKAAVKPQVGASLEALAERDERIGILTEENDRLMQRLALHFLIGTDEERAAAENLINDLRKQLEEAQQQLKTMTDSRDHYMRESAEAISQCTYYRKRLIKLGKLEE